MCLLGRISFLSRLYGPRQRKGTSFSIDMSVLISSIACISTVVFFTFFIFPAFGRLCFDSIMAMSNLADRPGASRFTHGHLEVGQGRVLLRGAALCTNSFYYLDE